MDRHVIKGRGKNRDKYLCYARLAGLSPSDGYVWLPNQRKAARWEEPSYSRDAYRDRIAAEHDGYFVKLIAPQNVVERVDELKTFIAKHARNATTRPNCYWLDDDWSGNEGPDYCWECACEAVDTAFANDPQTFVEAYGDCHGEWTTSTDYYDSAIDGGWSMDHDSTPNCETCGVPLDGTLTDHGTDQEIQALTTDCAPTFGDAEGWYELDVAIMNIRDDDPRWRKIARVVDAAMEAERQYVANQAVLSAAEGMTDVRVTLLGLLALRQEQKAPEPSYPMWNELLEWRKRSFAERYLADTESLRRTMFKAAKRFASTLGYAMSGDCIDAPYGGYIWHFVVEIEQYRRWQPKAFMEGRAHRFRPWDDKEEQVQNRDANPYPRGTEEHEQWDCGYVSSEHPLP